MGAKRTAVIILGFSLVAIIGSIAAFAFGTYQSGFVGLDVENEAFFVGTEGTVDVETYGTYSVYVNSDYSCDDTTVSIYEGDWEYFYKDCDPIMNERGWYYAGFFSSDFDGIMSVDSNHEIAIVDDMVYLESGGWAMLASGGACCLGIIGIIIAITILLTTKGENSGENLQHGYILVEQNDNAEVE